jgi:hypothetical protein
MTSWFFFSTVPSVPCPSYLNDETFWFGCVGWVDGRGCGAMQGKPHSDVVVKKVVEMVCVGGRMICNSNIWFHGRGRASYDWGGNGWKRQERGGWGDVVGGSVAAWWSATRVGQLWAGIVVCFTSMCCDLFENWTDLFAGKLCKGQSLNRVFRTCSYL